MISELLHSSLNYSRSEVTYEDETRLLQGVWNWMHIGNEYWITSSLFIPAYCLCIDLIFIALFSFMDLVLSDLPFFKKHKIQKDKKVTWPLLKKSLDLQLWNYGLWVFPIVAAQWCWVPATVLPAAAPTVFEVVSQITTFFLIYDFAYFWFHILCHKNKALYRWCHSVHHAYSSPFAVVTQHLHPFEMSFSAVTVPIIPFIFDTHPLTYWVWFFVTQLVGYEVHSGYDFPFALHRFFKYYGGAPSHDMHHLRPLTCFQPWFNYMDRLLGYHITYDDLKKMADNKNRRFGLYDKADEEGLDKIN